MPSILPGKDESGELFDLAKQELARQNQIRNRFVLPFLRALGLRDPEAAMSTLGPIFQQMFAQDVEQIGQSFGGQRTQLLDTLAQSGFRTGSQAGGLQQLALGQGQAEVQARRAALMNQLNSLFQGANIAGQQVATFNPVGLFGQSANFLNIQQANPFMQALQGMLSASGQAAQGALAGQ